MKRNLFVLITSLILLLSTSILVNAETPIKVMVNGEVIKFDVEPTIIEGRTLVPVRAIFEALGATVNWDGENKVVIAKKDNIEIQLPINKKNALINGQNFELEVPATIADSRTLVPVRFIAESLGAEVSWNNDTKTVSIDYSNVGRTYSVECGNDYGEILYYKENNNLPCSIEIVDTKDNLSEITLINYASHYFTSYSDIYIGTIKNNEMIERKIFESNKGFFSSNMEANDEWVLWTVDYLKDYDFYLDIYAYNISTSKTKVIANEIKSSDDQGSIKICASLESNYISWIEHNQDEEETQIMLYDLVTDQKKAIASFDFLQDTTMPYRVSFLTMKDEKIIFDVKDNTEEYNLYIYSLINSEIEKKISVTSNDKLHFCECGDYDSKNNLLVVYMLTDIREELGYIDLTSGEYNKLINLYESDKVYRVQIEGNKIFFNVQRLISGDAYDRHIGFIFDLQSEKLKIFYGSFELELKGEYITNVSYNINENTNKMSCEIFKLEDILKNLEYIERY